MSVSIHALHGKSGHLAFYRPINGEPKKIIRNPEPRPDFSAYLKDCLRSVR